MLPAFIDEFVKSAMNAGTASSPGPNQRGNAAMAEAVVKVKRPDLVPQASTQKILPGGAVNPSVSAAQKNTPPPSVYGN